MGGPDFSKFRTSQLRPYIYDEISKLWTARAGCKFGRRQKQCVYVEQMWSRDVVGVAEDLALGLMWNKNAVERDKTIVYD